MRVIDASLVWSSSFVASCAPTDSLLYSGLVVAGGAGVSRAVNAEASGVAVAVTERSPEQKRCIGAAQSVSFEVAPSNARRRSE
jgi:hypothetical protein